ncbi:hypothetical protein BDN71DRAFT_1432647 [Pleurotus eryngii]|uniref:Uncharacterized protein n=1 Tax=Pleurotus eryngii TaxID=5323 RepID=A0A9P6DEF9_PLEER|nr:hypothetical protein BDN71DRAFT_1432647 [Pleurotus eryngii]
MSLMSNIANPIVQKLVTFKQRMNRLATLYENLAWQDREACCYQRTSDLDIAQALEVYENTIELPVQQPTPTISGVFMAETIGSTSDINKAQFQQVPTLASCPCKAHRATVGKADNPKKHCKSVWIEQHLMATKSSSKFTGTW